MDTIFASRPHITAGWLATTARRECLHQPRAGRCWPPTTTASWPSSVATRTDPDVDESGGVGPSRSGPRSPNCPSTANNCCRCRSPIRPRRTPRSGRRRHRPQPEVWTGCAAARRSPRCWRRLRPHVGHQVILMTDHERLADDERLLESLAKASGPLARRRRDSSWPPSPGAPSTPNSPPSPMISGRCPGRRDPGRHPRRPGAAALAHFCGPGAVHRDRGDGRRAARPDRAAATRPVSLRGRTARPTPWTSTTWAGSSSTPCAAHHVPAVPAHRGGDVDPHGMDHVITS